MGYLLIQDHGEKEMIRLAFGPEAHIHSLILKAKTHLGALSVSNPPTPSTPLSPSPFSSNPNSNSNLSYASVVNGSSAIANGNGSEFVDDYQFQDHLLFLNDSKPGDLLAIPAMAALMMGDELHKFGLVGTRQTKLDQRKAKKLDIARSCILMDDANRFLENVRKAIMKKFVTLSENEETSIEFTNSGESVGEIFTGFNMQLDQVPDHYITIDPIEDNMADDQHQVDYNDITLTDLFQPSSNLHDRFERFDEGDEGTLDDFLEIPPTHIPSPVRQAEPQRAAGSEEQYPENDLGQQFKRNKEARDQQRQGLRKRKGKGIIIDDISSTDLLKPNTNNGPFERFEEGDEGTQVSFTSDDYLEIPPTHIPFPVRQAEPQRVSQEQYPGNDSGQPFERNKEARDQQKQGLRKQKPRNRRIVLSNSVFKSWLNDHSDIVKKRMKNPRRVKSVISSSMIAKCLEHPGPMIGRPHHLQLHHYLPCVRNSPPPPPPPPPPMGSPFEDLHGGSPSHADGDAVRSTSSSAPGDGVPSDNLEVIVERVGSMKSNVPSTSRNNSGLDTVHEAGPDFIVGTQQETPDILTEKIKAQIKTLFEKPGAPQVESLQNLAVGLTRNEAAQLFYQTCVLATQGFLRVQQDEPFEEISISKGDKL
ncbi:hypothetical protein V6N11_000048 [Hibiscus sabdariffa]|uniref:Sister chromatid cohesion 1 protein 1 n=2 Tax=Hibiscus sabdariffa TaxID=183260 RepID=A0ABR2NNH7_9ROSI